MGVVGDGNMGGACTKVHCNLHDLGYVQEKNQCKKATFSEKTAF